ncbi:hypothetical protein Egran_02142 [Elaphomyces granulatus]|uniref:Sugar phosphate transporter domain-containing protein n=1 Tax=Elaphomyces granulatus TaxID=519963 RepID=A0A232M114_9EURO|nr:hypothetical protein Egran_02142 [Elaphomyces granulatus]
MIQTGPAEMNILDSLRDQSTDEEIGFINNLKGEKWSKPKSRDDFDTLSEEARAFIRNSYRLADLNVIRRLLINAVFVGLWYMFSLTISIYNKWMFSDISVVFPFPLFATSLHMVVQFTLSTLVLYSFPSLRSRPPPAPGLARFSYLAFLLPCGIAGSLDIGLGNMSLRFISLTFLTICKSFSLAFVLLFAFIFRLETPSIRLTFVIAAITVGVVMMVAAETSFNAIGFALVISSAFFSGLRWTLTQFLILHQPATSNPFSTLFFLSPIMFVSLITISLAIEGPAQILHGFKSLSELHGPVGGMLLLIFPGILAFGMVSSQFALLKRASVVTLNVCGIFKELVTIMGANIVFHDELTFINATGVVITIGSIAYYNYVNVSKMRKEIRTQILQRESALNAMNYVDAPSKVQ